MFVSAEKFSLSSRSNLFFVTIILGPFNYFSTSYVISLIWWDDLIDEFESM